MHEPPFVELVHSVIEAGREWDLDISDRAGTLWIEGRAGEPVVPPVEIRFTGDELVEYYRRTVDEGGHEDTPQTPLEWWKTLVSTHLAEAVYQLGGLEGPALLRIDGYGFTAVPRV